MKKQCDNLIVITLFILRKVLYLYNNLKHIVMDTQAIYKLTDELTEQQVDNIISGWNNKRKKERFDILVRLGYSRELACATVMLDTFDHEGKSDTYRLMEL